MTTLPIAVPENLVAEFCRSYHIEKLSLFGSVLMERFGPESDVDVLVAFETEWIPGLLGMARMERELGEILGRKVDLRTAGDLSRYFRADVMAMAVPQYERG